MEMDGNGDINVSPYSSLFWSKELQGRHVLQNVKRMPTSVLVIFDLQQVSPV